MEILLISDIHSNIEALRTVIEKNKHIDKIFCLGDIVGYGASPNECIELLKEKNVKCIMGNHDAGVVEMLSIEWFNSYAYEAINWTKKVITKENIEYLKNLPNELCIDESLLIHGALIKQFNYMTSSSIIKTNLEIFIKEYQDQSICFFGHTHIPEIYENANWKNYTIDKRYSLREDKKYFINPGSIGQPRGGKSNKSSYCIYNDETYEIEFRESEYDIEKSANKILSKGLPSYLAQRLFTGV